MSNESGFSNLNKYIQKIMQLLIQSDKIARLLGDTEKNMYSSRKSSPENPSDLLNTKILPYDYISDIQTEVGSYINITFDKFKLSHGQILKDGFIVFESFCHKDVDETNYGYRHLLLCNEIDKIFNKGDIGIGELEFVVGEKISTLKKPYMGYRLVYRLRDFNKV